VALYRNILPDYFDKMALYFRIINQRVTKAKMGVLGVIPQLPKNRQ
jgi:hypothetical protein